MSEALPPDELMRIVARRNASKGSPEVPAAVYRADVDALMGALSEAESERDVLKGAAHEAVIELSVLLTQYSLQREVADALDRMRQGLRGATEGGRGAGREGSQ